MKKEIKVWEYAGKILEGVSKGALVTVNADGKANPMTIGWGTLGIEWGKPIFTVFVRKSRYTKEFLDKNREFTVNIALGDPDKNIISVCGTRSGRELDKVSFLGLTPEEAQTVAAPGFREMPLTLECKVIYQQDQDPAAIDPDCDSRYYAKGTANEGDYHTAYYGLITGAYIIE